jgi:predicted transcriptional regulator
MSTKSLEMQIKELLDKELERILGEVKKDLEKQIGEINGQIERLRQYLKSPQS